MTTTPIATITGLTFRYSEESPPIFNQLDYNLYPGMRYILCGRNGCGKSTLLELLAGRRLAPSNTISVDGIDPFRNTRVNNIVGLLNNQWGMRTVAYCGYNLPLQSSISVDEMMISRKRNFPEREKILREVLMINLEWRLNNISEGQRKRVQLYLNLLQPYKLLLLDEITVNLDVVIKSRFMDFLYQESTRGCTIVYVTHIFDGLGDWCNRVIHMEQGRLEETAIEKIPQKDVYHYILKRITSSASPTSKNPEPPETPQEYRDNIGSTNNAGGYTNGTLTSL